MTAPINRNPSVSRSQPKPTPSQSAATPNTSRLAAKLDRLVFAAAAPGRFGLD